MTSVMAKATYRCATCGADTTETTLCAKHPSSDQFETGYAYDIGDSVRFANGHRGTVVDVRCNGKKADVQYAVRRKSIYLGMKGAASREETVIVRADALTEDK